MRVQLKTDKNTKAPQLNKKNNFFFQIKIQQLKLKF